MINIAICDDEKSVVAKVREIADEVLSQADCTYVVNEYADSRSLISDVCEGGHIDIAILSTSSLSRHIRQPITCSGTYTYGVGKSNSFIHKAI